MSLNYSELDSSKIEFVEIGEVGDLPNGEKLFVEIDDLSIVVFNIAGKLFAIEDVCSHDNGPLGDGDLEEDYEIACPRHGARFDVRTGEALTFPAVTDIPAYPVQVEDGVIVVGIPIEE
jgi:3-phenylpropionate/trans-cinnamate dioxygenase ferredoxin subunit